MSEMCKTVTEVIVIEDDEDEDVKVVFSNLNETHVNRNLVYQKISQEIEILEAMRNHTIPFQLYEFKELSKKLGLKYDDNIIQSAWQRVMKKYFKKLNDLQNNKTPPCLLRPPQPPVIITPPQATSSQSSTFSVTVTTPYQKVSISSTPTSSSTSAVPVALLMNQVVNRKLCNPNTEYPIFNSAQETQADVKSVVIAKSNIEKQVFPKQKETTTVCAVKTEVSSDKKRKRKADILNSDMQGLSRIESKRTGKIPNSLVSDLLEGNSCSVLSEQNTLSMKKTVKSSQNKTSSNKSVDTVDTPRTVQQLVEKSKIGVKAKIVRVKKSSPNNSRKRWGKKVKEMSEAELKEFKAEQKRLKLEQEHEFQQEQLQKVADRLVEILIPKYHNKDLDKLS